MRKLVLEENINLLQKPFIYPIPDTQKIGINMKTVALVIENLTYNISLIDI